MTYLFVFFATIAILATADALDMVCFRKAYIRKSMETLKNLFGEGPFDYRIAEQSRRELVMESISVGIACWAIAGWAYRSW